MNKYTRQTETDGQCETIRDHAQRKLRSKREKKDRHKEKDREKERERTRNISRTSEPRESSCGTDSHFRTIVEKSWDYPLSLDRRSRDLNFAHPSSVAAIAVFATNDGQNLIVESTNKLNSANNLSLQNIIITIIIIANNCSRINYSYE